MPFFGDCKNISLRQKVVKTLKNENLAHFLCEYLVKYLCEPVNESRNCGDLVVKTGNIVSHSPKFDRCESAIYLWWMLFFAGFVNAEPVNEKQGFQIYKLERFGAEMWIQIMKNFGPKFTQSGLRALNAIKQCENWNKFCVISIDLWFACKTSRQAFDIRFL